MRRSWISADEPQGIHMALTTIGWTCTGLPDGRVVKGYTFNPWEGCERVSEGCEHCYAERSALSRRMSLGPESRHAAQADARGVLAAALRVEPHG
jgi:protein gp37